MALYPITIPDKGEREQLATRGSRVEAPDEQTSSPRDRSKMPLGQRTEQKNITPESQANSVRSTEGRALVLHHMWVAVRGALLLIFAVGCNKALVFQWSSTWNLRVWRSILCLLASGGEERLI